MTSRPAETIRTAGQPAWMERLGPAQRERVLAGRSRQDPRRIGSLVGLAGGAVFVLANVGFAAYGVLVAAIVLTIALVAATLIALFVKPKPLGAPQDVGVAAWWVYLGSVAGMLALIALAKNILTSNGHEAAIPVAIAVAVGAHFLPFAAAFRERHFLDLGIALVVLGGVGVVLAIITGAPAGDASAVAVGVVMLSMMLAYAVRGRALSARR